VPELKKTTFNLNNKLTVNPNPVREAKVLISYQLAEHGKVTMWVVDFHGRSFQNADIGFKEAGAYTNTLSNLAKLAAGNNLILLEQNGKVIARIRFFLIIK
jgi:hypothetical protein